MEGVRLSQGPPERPERVGTWADPWGLGGCTEKHVGDRTFWFLQITAEEELQACDSLWLPPVASGLCQGAECQGVQGPQTPGEGKTPGPGGPGIPACLLPGLAAEKG